MATHPEGTVFPPAPRLVPELRKQLLNVRNQLAKLFVVQPVVSLKRNALTRCSIWRANHIEAEARGHCLHDVPGIGTEAYWVSILSSRQYRVGDRIQLGGVRGDVLDITPLRTKLLEIGSAADEGAWVRARQYTGRIVSISNKATFTEPVYNSSAAFDYLWEELTLPVPYHEDWQHAERILQEEAERTSSSAGARDAVTRMRRRYPVGRADVEPRVFLRATDNWAELSARFVVPVRDARRVKDEMTRRVLHRFDEAGLSVASATQEVTVRPVEKEKE